MANGICTLLVRNLLGVFEESDPQRRRATIEEIFTEDARFYEPGGVRQGWEEIDRIADTIRVMHPTFAKRRCAHRKNSTKLQDDFSGYRAYPDRARPMPGPIS